MPLVLAAQLRPLVCEPQHVEHVRQLLGSHATAEHHVCKSWEQVALVAHHKCICFVTGIPAREAGDLRAQRVQKVCYEGKRRSCHNLPFSQGLCIPRPDLQVKELPRLQNKTSRCMLCRKTAWYNISMQHHLVCNFTRMSRRKLGKQLSVHSIEERYIPKLNGKATYHAV